jgi:heme-degrading monooxygenase HmoA
MIVVTNRIAVALGQEADFRAWTESEEFPGAHEVIQRVDVAR